MRSILPEVRTAVTDGIRAALVAANEKKVGVTYAYEGSDETRRREQIFTNRARATHDPAALKPGRNFREEVMDFEIVVLVISPGKKPHESEERAFELGQYVEEFIADRKSNGYLEVAGLQWIRMVSMEVTPALRSDASITELVYSVRYTARLT